MQKYTFFVQFGVDIIAENLPNSSYRVLHPSFVGFSTITNNKDTTIIINFRRILSKS